MLLSGDEANTESSGRIPEHRELGRQGRMRFEFPCSTELAVHLQQLRDSPPGRKRRAEDNEEQKEDVDRVCDV